MKAPSSKGKWIVFGVNAALTALALLPQSRKQNSEPKPVFNVEPQPDPKDALDADIDYGVFGLLFLDNKGEVMSSYKFERNIVINRFDINQEEVMRVTRESGAYAAVITFNRHIFNPDISLNRERFIQQIANALTDAGVRVFQRAFMGTNQPSRS